MVLYKALYQGPGLQIETFITYKNMCSIIFFPHWAQNTDTNNTKETYSLLGSLPRCHKCGLTVLNIIN